MNFFLAPTLRRQCMSDSSVTADNKVFAFLKWTNHFTTYLARLDQDGTHIIDSRRFTLSETADQPLDWSPDGNTLIYARSTEEGSDLYAAPVNGEGARRLTIGHGASARSLPFSDY